MFSSRVNSRLFQSVPMWLYVLFFFPGTLIHELSHYFAAKLLFVPVGNFSLFPTRGEREVILGSVAIARVDTLRRTLVGVAPMFFGVVLILAGTYLTISYRLYSDWRVAAMLGYFLFVISNSMFSSRQDLKGSWRLFVFIVLIGTFLYLAGVKIKINIPEYDFLRTLAVYLLIPIVLNGLLLLLLDRRYGGDVNGKEKSSKEN